MHAFKLLTDAVEKERALQWQGAFADYLDIVRHNPAVARSSHARVYDMIQDKGYTARDGVRSYHFFTDHLFGIEYALQQLVDGYFRPAAKRLEVRHRILLLVGPVSSGKSSIATLLKRGLEHYSKTDAGALYGLAGCPMHEEPLHLVPPDLRPELESELGVRIEGSLCPVCRLRLKEEFHGQMALFPVRRVLLSEQQRMGIGTFQPRDPRNQDIAELTGSIDLAAISRYGAESDPRAYRFDGELNVANRGLLEMQEILKCDERFLWHLLSLAQEGEFKAGRFALISADEVVVGHCNEEDYRAFAVDKRNKALLSRLLVVPIPYTMLVTAEERIYAKIMRASEIEPKHIAPNTLRSLAQFTILTREPEKPATTTQPGMCGVDPRLVANSLCSTLATDTECINAAAVLRQLTLDLNSCGHLSTSYRERYLRLVLLAAQHHQQASKADVLQAVIRCSFTAVFQTVEKYLGQVVEYCSREQDQQQSRSTPVAIDMQRFEALMGVAETTRETFRAEMATRLHSVADISVLLPKDPHALADSELGMAGAAYILAQLNVCDMLAIGLCLQTEFGYCDLCAQQLLFDVVGAEVT